MKKLTALLGLTMAITATAAPMMNIFELGVQQGKTAKYDSVAEHNISTSIQNEKGTLAMYSVKSKDEPNLAYMVEIYANDAAYEAHCETPHFKAYIPYVGALIAEKWTGIKPVPTLLFIQSFSPTILPAKPSQN